MTRGRTESTWFWTLIYQDFHICNWRRPSTRPVDVSVINVAVVYTLDLPLIGKLVTRYSCVACPCRLVKVK